MKKLLLLLLLFVSFFVSAQVTYPLKTIGTGSGGGSGSGIDSIRFLNTGVLHSPTAAYTKIGNTGVVTQSLTAQAAGTIFGNSTTSSAAPTFSTTPVIATSLGIGSTTQPVSTALLELTSTTRGLLLPRMTTAQRDAIVSPSFGLSIFNTSTNTHDYHDGTIWRNISSYTRRDNTGIIHADANGIVLQNNTPATVGLNQAPPDIVAMGLGWGTTTGTSQRIGYRLKVDATSATVPISVITMDSWFNGSYQTEMTLTGGSARSASFAGAGTFAGIVTAPSITLPFNGTGIVFSAAQGSIFNNAGIFTYNASQGHLLTSSANALTAGTTALLNITGTFNPTSGTATNSGLTINNTVNQTGSANGITRGLHINTTVTAATDHRALEISSLGKIVFTSTITPSGTTGAQTINRISGKVNAAAGTTSLVVTNNLVTANSIVWCMLGSNDATARINNVVESAGSFTINYVAPTAETVIKFVVIN